MRCAATSCRDCPTRTFAALTAPRCSGTDGLWFGFGAGALRVSGAGAGGSVKGVMAGWKHALCSKATAVTGSPVVLFITHSTPRSLDIHQSFKRLDKQMRVQKLISKRQKAEEQAKALGAEDVRVVVGTPQRMCKLADMSSLQLQRVTHIFVDSAKDVKGFTLFTIDDIKRYGNTTHTRNTMHHNTQCTCTAPALHLHCTAFCSS